MAYKKYSLIYKEIINYSNLEWKDVLNNSFYSMQKEIFETHDSKGNCRKCQLITYIKNDDEIFGKFGLIKQSSSENASAIINGQEYDEVDIKYSVQFLISIRDKKIIYIYNNNASCFEEDIMEWVESRNNTIRCFSLVQIPTGDLAKKIKEAKKITHLIITKKDQESISMLFNEFGDKVKFTSVKTTFKIKEKQVDKDALISYVNTNRQSNYQLKFVDSENVEHLAKFTDYFFNKAKKVPIAKEDLKNHEAVYSILKLNLYEEGNEY